MSDEPKPTSVLSELRNKGHLPALDSSVASVCTLTDDPLTGTAELTSVILRDPALTANIISIANSVLYHPAEPVTTVSTAILIIGFECIRTLALGLGILKQVGETAKDRSLYRLLTCSYFSGMFAMSLAQKAGQKNPEELLVAGMLSQLPRLLLAHAFPDRYAVLERRMTAEKLPLDRACQEVFGTSYHGLAVEIAQFWGLPACVARHIRGEMGNDTLGTVVKQAGQISDMMFGNQPGGVAALAASERELQKVLHDSEFKLGEFISETCESDPNVNRLFRLSQKDVKMMVSIMEWGRVSSAEVAASLVVGASDELSGGKVIEDPSVLIGQYLTELIRIIRRRPDINRVLLTGLEAIHRCVRPECALLAFPDAAKQRLQGRFLLGSGGKASGFVADLQDDKSPIVRCLKSQEPLQLQARQDLPGSFLTRANLNAVLLAPIVVDKKSIGLCLIGREKATPFSEQEQLWIDAVVSHFSTAFERSGSKN
jgi:HD-like signal output (HDOD) protein